MKSQIFEVLNYRSNLKLILVGISAEIPERFSEGIHRKMGKPFMEFIKKTLFIRLAVMAPFL